MRTKELEYDLPIELIAQQPARIRSKSRLLVLDRDSGRLTESSFEKIGDFLRAGDCLVLNDTKVIPARFFGHRSSGGKIEGLFLSEIETGLWLVMLKGAHKVKLNEKIILADKRQKKGFQAALVERRPDGFFTLKLETNRFGKLTTGPGYQAILEKIGFPPLPPYIKRDKNLKQAKADRLRYQTVFAKTPGAVAAPTAGLHFTQSLIGRLKKQGILFAHITLHTGTGTFKPVTAETIEQHKIGTEYFSIDEKNAQLINAAKKNGGRIIAVGTTSVRTLETVAEDSKIRVRSGTTGLFIRPGFEFKIIDGIITNFHLPRSTLLALVAAFAGLDKVKAAYAYAATNRYRFYSYGDAMLII
jgi:S-adenosylmethionine:tRNA ribosyltransferase-isomerase